MRVCTGTRVHANTGVALKRSGEAVIRGSRVAIILSCPEGYHHLRYLSRRAPPPGTSPLSRSMGGRWERGQGEVPGGGARAFARLQRSSETRIEFLFLRMRSPG